MQLEDLNNRDSTGSECLVVLRHYLSCGSADGALSFTGMPCRASLDPPPIKGVLFDTLSGHHAVTDERGAPALPGVAYLLCETYSGSAGVLR
jgi:hypothetical protein